MSNEPVVILKVNDEVYVYGQMFILTDFILKHNEPPQIMFKHLSELMVEPSKQKENQNGR